MVSSLEALAATANCSEGLCLEAWSTMVRSICGSFSFESERLPDFTGWASVSGIGSFDAMHARNNTVHVHRKAADVRRDDNDFFFLIGQLSGRSVMEQNDDILSLAPGELTLIDSTKPSVFHFFEERSHLVSLHLPRNLITTYLGFVPNGASAADSGGISSRALFSIISDSGTPNSLAANRVGYLDCAILDLIGASFDRRQVFHVSESTQSNLLFSRVCALIQRKCLNPEFSAAHAANSAGISMRYLQKVFAARGTSCTHFILSCRLDHAARLLRRRKTLDSKVSISEIAHISGFGDAAYFSRAFSDYFGCTPSTY